MDADKRHQLKTNELAEALSKVRDFISEPQMRYWLIGLVVLVVAVVGYRWRTGQQERQMAGAWTELTRVGAMLETDPDAACDDLRALIADSPDGLFAANARVRLGILLRRQAEEDADGSDELLSESVEVLRRIVDDSAAPPALVAAAAFSLGTACESLRDFDGAAAAYQQIIDEQRFTGSPFIGLAARRLDTIDELSVPVHFEPGMPPEPEPKPEPAPEPEPELTPEQWPPPATQPTSAPPARPARPTPRPPSRPHNRPPIPPAPTRREPRRGNPRTPDSHRRDAGPARAAAHPPQAARPAAR